MLVDPQANAIRCEPRTEDTVADVAVVEFDFEICLVRSERRCGRGADFAAFDARLPKRWLLWIVDDEFEVVMSGRHSEKYSARPKRSIGPGGSTLFWIRPGGRCLRIGGAGEGFDWGRTAGRGCARASALCQTEQFYNKIVLTVGTLWVPAVNKHGGFGRSDFVEIDDLWDAQNLLRSCLAERRESLGTRYRVRRTGHRVRGLVSGTEYGVPSAEFM